MRKALIVGIDHYESIGSLHGAVSDAHSVKNVLERHTDGTTNFAQPRLMVASSSATAVHRTQLREAIQELFRDQADIALLYFSGHGYIDETGGFLCPSDCVNGHDGLTLTDVMAFASRSPAKNKIIILDCCHSGDAGNTPMTPAFAQIKDGVTILTASTANQYAMESGGSGVYTSLLVDALNGSAANLVGDVTPGSVYAHVDQSLGPWMQRPVFKTNVESFVSLRRAEAPIALVDLHRLTALFVEPAAVLPLDPSYEPERNGSEPEGTPPPDPLRTADFAVLQELAKVNLVRPVGEKHMWHAAMNFRGCELTVLGQHYWALVDQARI